MTDKAGAGRSFDDDRDDALKDSFPASDAPARSGVTGIGRPDQPPHQRPAEPIPTGTPTSDRHGTETAHHPENEETSAND